MYDDACSNNNFIRKYSLLQLFCFLFYVGLPIAIVNHGETRAERSKLANVVFKSDANCGALLGQVAELCTPRIVA